MKNKAFTLAEVLIAMTIIGIVAAILLTTIRADRQVEKTFAPKANKAIELFDEGATQLLDIDKTNCPMSEFIINETEKGLYNSSGTAVTSQEAFDLFSEYIKFEKTGLNFCANSGYCESSTTIPGGKISGDIYVGVAVNDIADCPDFYRPGTAEKITVANDLLSGAKPKCWAKLYIDVNGSDGPNTEGKDVFVLGFDRKGVHR